MRIFQICADPGIGPDGTKGASIHFRSLHRALAAAGHDVIAFMARGTESQLPPADFRALVPLRSAQSIVDAAAAGQPDFLYERYALGETAGLEAAKRLGRPLILEVNAPLVREAAAWRPDTLRPGHAGIEERLFREADVVLAVSEPLREFVAAIRGSDEGTIVVANGFDPRGAGPPYAQAEPATIVFLGHPKPWHGADRLIPMLTEIRNRRPLVRLLVIGGGPGAAPIVEAARSAGLEESLEITGPVAHEAVPDLLGRAAVAVAPYPPTPFFYFCPIKVIECMGAGIPVVTTAQGDLPAIVGDAGVLVPPDDTLALAAAVAGLLEDPSRRAAIATRARARVRRSFTWDHAAERIRIAGAALLAGARTR